MTSNEWKEYTFSDFANFKYGKMPKKDKIVENGIYPIYSGYRHVGRYNEYNIDKEILVIVARGVGGTGDVKLTKEKCYLTNLSIAVDSLDKEIAVTKYLYYYFQLHNLRYLDSGSAQSQITISDLEKLKILLPPLETQQKIAKVLSAIDEKIELNNSINNNLEQQAQAIFKSWFVDFEPFGGTMPDDWSYIQLSDIASFVGGYSYKGTELQDSDCAMATIKNFDRNGGFKLDGFKEIIPSVKLKDTQKVELFDILVAHTDLTQNAEVIGNAELLLSKLNYKKIILSMDLVKVIPNNGISKFLLATLLKTKLFKSHSLGYVNGTTVLHLSKKALPEYSFAFPNDINTINDISVYLEKIYLKIANNINENMQLTTLRDTLLPKLMSGEIDVSKVDISTDKLSFSEDK